MIRRLRFIYRASVLLASCVSNHIGWRANAKVKKLKLGMDRVQVIVLLGENYLVAAPRTSGKTRSRG